jgi:hypothetical protein
LRCCGRQGALELEAEVEAAAELEAPIPDPAPAADPVLEDPPVEYDTITAPRPTSVVSLLTAVDGGALKTRRQQVLGALREMGEATANEVFEYLKRKQVIGAKFPPNICARLTELRDLGLIREGAERECRISKQACISWAIVPMSEYAGEAIVRRCEKCGQIIAREVPRLRAAGHGPAS